MQTIVADKYRNLPNINDAEEMLHRCVHCGFCNATCPTFQLLGDELDGPRGRIYLIKKILEGSNPTPSTRKHLDRCLTCQSCETTCPSGEQHTPRLELGRQEHHTTQQRPLKEKCIRILLRKIILRPQQFKHIVHIALTFSFLLPSSLKNKIPPLGIMPTVSSNAEFSTADVTGQTNKERTLIMLRGCAQKVCAPEINQSATELFIQLGFNVIESSADRCCGALSHHNDATEEARELARRNIDAWWPLLEHGVEGIVITASGCATMVKDYGHLLADDAGYADRACKIADLCRDPVEILEPFHGQLRKRTGMADNICFQAPCSQQHGLAIRGRVEQLLRSAGYKLTQQNIAHLCCGSAGSYSTLQPEISGKLKNNKLQDLCKAEPSLISTANIGCLLHLQSGTEIPVKHWLQVIEVNELVT